MKRIGIFTFMQSNYGAILQAYALQNFIQNNSDHKVEIINFCTKNHKRKDRLIRASSDNFIFRIIFILLSILRYPELKRRKVRTQTFKNTHMNLSRRYCSIDEVITSPPCKDIYLSGSDQVFNPNGQYYRVYYLDFNKKSGRKVAYAPSFGIANFDDKIKQQVSKYLLDFDALSCREKTGADFIASIVGHHVPTVVDPTLLLSKEKWNQVAIMPPINFKYIFIYDLNGAEKNIEIAKRIQKYLDLPIVCLTNKVQKFYPIEKQIFDAGPAEFIGWIANATFVVTDSFHGTVFSTIFQRDFLSYVAAPNTSSRVRTLLSALDLESRLIEHNEVNEYFLKNEMPLKCNYTINTQDIVSDSIKFIHQYILQ